MNSIASANQGFAFNLLRQAYAGSSDKSTQVSPFSVRRALTMAALGARGDTLAAFLDVFGLPKGSDLVAANQFNQSTLQRLLTAEAKSKAPTEISVANALWLKKDDGAGYTFLPKFKDANKKWYDATVEDNLPFDESTLNAINAWCLAKTKKIPRILEEIPGGARAFITDALYMKTPATNRFYKRNDSTGLFTPANGAAREVTFMTNPWERFRYFKGDGVQILEFPFGERYMFNYYVVLPDADSSLDATVAKLTADNWLNWKANLSRYSGKFRLPANEQEFSADLATALCQMGLGVAFDDELADFLDMCTGRLKIGGVQHKTYTKFTRKGFEGAAVTAIGMIECTSVGAPDPTFDLTIDRPYAWFVTGGDEILFAATTADPKEPQGFAEETDDDNEF